MELAGIIITNVKPCIDLLVCYRAPGMSLSQESWNEIFYNVEKNKFTLLMGDFNAHNKIWNCEKTDSNGDRLHESLTNSNMLLHNFDTLTHIIPNSYTYSNIDLIFSSTNISNKINTKDSDDTLGSDHFPIFINVNRKTIFINVLSKKAHTTKSPSISSRYELIGQVFPATLKIIMFTFLLLTMLNPPLGKNIPFLQKLYLTQ